MGLSDSNLPLHCARRILSRLVLSLSVMLFGSSASWALATDQPLAELRHAQWSIADGAPANITALAQTPDGFLWLGTATGLYRFDGIKFEHIEAVDRDSARSLQVTALLAASNGDLWVGYDYGGVARYRRGKLRAENDEIPRGSVVKIIEPRNGEIWFASMSSSTKRIRYYQAGRWHWFRSGTDLPDEETQSIFSDSEGNVFAVFFNSIWRFDRHRHRFVRQKQLAKMMTTIEKDRAGALWLVDNNGLRRFDGSSASMKVGEVKGWTVMRTLLFDRQGSLWITGQEGSLLRLSDKGLQELARGKIDRSLLETRKDILGPIPLSALEDREGNVWIGNAGGLDRYSAIDVHLSKQVPTLVTGLIKTLPSGSLFVGTTQGVYRIDGSPARPKLELPVKSLIISMCVDATGDALVATSNGFALLSKGRWSQFPFSLPLRVVPTSCVAEGDGNWLMSAYGLFRLRGRTLSRVEGAEDSLGRATLMRSLGSHDVLSYRALDSLTRTKSGRVSTLWQGRGIPVGFIKTVVPFGRGMLIGGEHGIAWYDGKSFATIDDRAHPFLANVTGILPTADASTWIITAQGIARVRTEDLDATFRHPARRLMAFVYGRDMGLRGRSTGYDMADIARSSDGIIWFATNRGLAWIDPKKLTSNSLPPPVIIRGLQADDRPADLFGDAPKFPPGTQRISIDFTALSFTDPAANQFRFRLTGFDKNWIEAGARRQATYGNLSPGSYRFQVIAANGDGVWNETGATIEFSIAPYFYQTWWFMMLAGILVIFVAVVLLRWRTRNIAQAIRSRVEARVDERERIARELHDTLLQGLQGLLMRFQAVAEVIPANSRARVMIEKTLERGDDVVVQSRERVRDLRSSAPGDLERHIEDLGYEEAEIRVWGARRLVCGPVIDEVGAIVSEALSNTQRHARATHVSVDIRYGFFTLSIRVKDDGDGIDQAILANGGRSGHFGLQGMRERAAKLGGLLKIESSSDSGTLVQVKVPARIAYRTLAVWPWRRSDEANL